MAQKLMNKYIETLPKEIEQLKEDVAQENFPAAARMAHSMKGSSGNLRVTKIFKLASELELVLKAEQEGTKEKADAIIMELAEIMQKLL